MKKTNKTETKSVIATLLQAPRYFRNKNGSHSVAFRVQPENGDAMELTLHVPKGYDNTLCSALRNKYKSLSKDTRMEFTYNTKTVVSCGEFGQAIEKMFHNVVSAKAITA